MHGHTYAVRHGLIPRPYVWIAIYYASSDTSDTVCDASMSWRIFGLSWEDCIVTDF